MTIKVLVDWNKDGDFSDYLENVTAQVLRSDQIALSYGRDSGTSLSATTAGTGGFTLSNASRLYSPYNTASPLYAYLKPSRPVKITRTVGGVEYVLFNGHTDTTPANPDLSARSVSVSLVDNLADFRGYDLHTPLYRGVRTGEAIGYVLDEIGWPAALRDLDPGATLIPWWWEDGTDALTALEKLVQSEGLPALVTIGADGAVVFRDRHHRLTRSESLTSQSTWRSKGTIEPVMTTGFSFDRAWPSIVNTASKSVDVRVPGQLQQVWTSEATFTFSAGQQRLITASTSDPFYNAVVPVQGTDFTVVSGNVTASLTRTSGASTGIVLTAAASPAVIRGLSLRAYPVPVGYTVDVSASDSASIDDYGSRSMPNDMPWAAVDDAQAILDLTVAQRSDPLPVLTARFMVGTKVTRAAAVLSRDLSDRVTVIEPQTGTNADFYVESIRHEFTGEFDHTVTFDVEAAPASITNQFRFDVAGRGFNDGVFGDGRDDPANMFRFDGTSGHRFDEGVFAA